MKMPDLKKILTLNKQTKIILSIILAVLCLLCFAIINFYFNTPETNENTVQESTSADDKLEIYMSKNGFYGVTDNEGNEIISPMWNSITALPNGNFIASSIMNNEEVYGIIDNEENVIAAFAYSEIRYIEDNLIIGKICDSGHYILMRNDGSLYTDKTWNSYDISGESNIVLSKNRSKYNASISGGKIVFKSFEFKESAASVPITFKSGTDGFEGYISADDFEKTAKIIAEYIAALSDGNKESIKNLTSPEYYEKIIPVEIIGRTIINISDAVTAPVHNEAGCVSYYTEFTVEYSYADGNAEEIEAVYTGENQTEENPSNKFLFTVITEKTSDGIVIISSSECKEKK